MVGNGFDVSLGIKSSYSRFYEWYCDKNSEKPHINSFRKEIKNDVNRNVPNEEKTWADFEIGLGKYTSEFTVDTVDDFLDCLEDAQGSIIEYLTEQERQCDFTQYSNESYMQFAKSLCDFYDEISDLEKLQVSSMLNGVPNENREIYFLTFNYTHTLEQILEHMPNETLKTWRHGTASYGYIIKRNVLHVHGTTDEFPVLGVNDESQIENTALIETPQFRELLIKAENVNALGKLWHRQAEERISNSRVVCILGMSIGASDAKWWRKIVQWLKANTSRHLIIYWHESDPPNGISSRKQLKCVEQTKERLLSYAELSPNEKQTLKERMHVVINTSKFMRLKKAERNTYTERLEEAITV